MHEYAIVENLVNSLLKELEAKKISKVRSVEFKRGSAFSESALLQTFTAVTKGTPLENADLKIQVVVLNLRCACGKERRIDADDLVGHMYVCPDCGHVKEIEEAHDLELLGVEIENE